MDSSRVTSPGAQHRRPFETNVDTDLEVISESSPENTLTEKNNEDFIASSSSPVTTATWGNLRSPKLEGGPIKWLQKIVYLGLVLSASLSVLIVIFTTLPKLESLSLAGGKQEEGMPIVVLKIPANMEELRMIRNTLSLYQTECPGRVLLAFGALYLFFQTFMIPGSLLLAILSGSIFGFYLGFAVILTMSSTGSSLCYLLSQALLKDVIVFYFPQRCDYLSREVQRHRLNLFNYVLCLRIVPIIPSWFVNVASPVVSVPFREFILGTLVGNIPSTVICVKAGGFLSHLKSVHDLYDTRTILALLSMGAVALAPVFLKNQCGSHLRNQVQGPP